MFMLCGKICFENIFVSVRLCVHTNLLKTFLQSVNNIKWNQEERNSLNIVEKH